MHLGTKLIGDTLTFTRQTQNRTTGVAVDADSVPTYRVYEDETTTPILTGSMALLDSSNTDGWYSEQITLSTANGFEKSKSYSLRIADTVATVAGAVGYNFAISPAGPFERSHVASPRILPVKSRTDGTFGVVGRIYMQASETFWFAANLAGTQLAAGRSVYAMSAPTVSGAQAANLSVADYGVYGTLAKFQCVTTSGALSTDTINVVLSVSPESGEVLLITVPVTIG